MAMSDELTLNIAGTSGRENGTVPKQSRPIMAETDCRTVGNEYWMFDPRLADVVSQFAHFLIWRH